MTITEPAIPTIADVEAEMRRASESPGLSAKATLLNRNSPRPSSLIRLDEEGVSAAEVFKRIRTGEPK